LYNPGRNDPQRTGKGRNDSIYLRIIAISGSYGTVVVKIKYMTAKFD